MLDANDRSKDIVTCEAWSIGPGAEPPSLPPEACLGAKMAAAPVHVRDPLVPRTPIHFALFVVLETSTTL